MNKVYIEITATRGSAPRDAGTAMAVTLTETQGTIGGGALEYQAIAEAHEMLRSDAPARTRTVPLGPELGQCCGGAVTLQFGYEARPVDQPGHVLYPIGSHKAHPTHLWLWGAGHVGRAVVDACHPQAFDITWIDDAADRFPAHVGTHVKTVPVADMPLLASRAPTHAHHLIFTYSHDIDLALCAALLKRGAASIGLIGSDTKWARFSRLLRAMGLDPAPINCPIGDKSLGKAPAQIAQGVVASLIYTSERKVQA